MTLELQATPENVMRAVEALQEFARARDIPEATIFGLALALEECGSNIVNHALRRDPGRKFHVSIGCTSGEFVIELRDPGAEFNPNATSERGASPEHDDAVGGWGIQLVRRYMDDIRYRREDGENVLQLVKRLAQKPGGTD